MYLVYLAIKYSCEYYSKAIFNILLDILTYGKEVQQVSPVH